jgi:hypothetical protein
VSHDLVGAVEIAEMFGISLKDFDEFTGQNGFTECVTEMPSGRIWSNAAVQEWAREQGRTVKEDGPVRKVTRLVKGPPGLDQSTLAEQIWLRE